MTSEIIPCVIHRVRSRKDYNINPENFPIKSGENDEIAPYNKFRQVWKSDIYMQLLGFSS